MFRSSSAGPEQAKRVSDTRTSAGPSLLPREHGAYAQIAFPQITALALGRPGWAALLLLAAIVCVFLLHEPLMILTGARGGRARREQAHRARRRAALLLAVALPAGAGGLLLAGTGTRLAALIVLALAALLLPLILSRQEKTAPGELLVAVTLASTMVPVAFASGVAPRVAGIAAGVWMIAFTLSTITVRSIIARAKRDAAPGWAHFAAPLWCAAAITAAFALAVAGHLPTLAAVAVVPTALVALIFGSLGIHPRNLRRMGWSLVASNVVALLALIAGFR